MNSRRLRRPAANASTVVELQRRCRAADLVQLGIVHRSGSSGSTSPGGDEHLDGIDRDDHASPGTLSSSRATDVSERYWRPVPLSTNPAGCGWAILRTCVSPRSASSDWSCRSTRPSRPPGTRSRAGRSRRRSSGSRPTRASSASARATRWTASRPSSTCSSARTRWPSPATSGSLETIDFHAGRYWPLEAALWDIVGQVAGLPGRDALRRRRRTPSPPTPRAGCCCRPRSVPSRPSACARRASRALKIRIDPRRLEEGLAAVAATRDAVGDSMAIMVDLNQGWRMAGDTVRLARSGRAPARSRHAWPTTASSGSRSRWPARTCAGWRRCARRRPGSGSPAAR